MFTIHLYIHYVHSVQCFIIHYAIAPVGCNRRLQVWVTQVVDLFALRVD